MLACTLAAVLGTLAAAGGRQGAAAAPISLHPANPHYFLWRGRPAPLITSGEHYGAEPVSLQATSQGPSLTEVMALLL